MAENITNWHLVLFAEGSYDLRAAGRRLKRQAEESGLFSTITLDNKRTLIKNHSDFYFTFKDFISKNPKGYGKWIWKPYLILFKLAQIEKGDGVLYLDAGCYLNLMDSKARIRMYEYLDLARMHGSLAMQVHGDGYPNSDLSDNFHSKLFLQDKLSVDEVFYRSNQIVAGIVFFMNEPRNHSFVQEWLDILTNNHCEILNDSYYEEKCLDTKYFRWDQSVFSLLYKSNMKYTIRDETYFHPDWSVGSQFPIWAMRWKLGKDPIQSKPRDYFTIVISYILQKKRKVVDSILYRIR